MKTKLLLLLAIIYSAHFFGQCPTTTITLSSQTDVDNFTINFPGCTDITNGLIISGNTIQNLNGLSGITSITGDLIINGNNGLDYLTGLDNLTEINGNLEITNSDIINASGLGALTTITGDFIPKSLRRFIGLSSLTLIGGDLFIQGNIQMQGLYGLSALTSIGGSLELRSNSSFSSFAGASLLTSIGGDLIIFSCYNITSYFGLENLITIGGSLDVPNNLNTFSGLDSLFTIGGDLDIGNSDVTTLDGLLVLENIGGDFIVSGSDMVTMDNSTIATVNGSLEINNNSMLTNVTLNGLATLGEEFLISDNSQLSTVSGFSFLNEIHNSLNINNNGSLISIPEFSGLTNITENLILNNNDTLSEVSSFQNLLQVGGLLEISNSNNLSSISGFQLLNTSQALTIDSNPNLTNIQSFNVLNHITSDLTILSNSTLPIINNFNSLATVDGTLLIQNNNALEEINNFNAIHTVGGLKIHSNANLITIDGLESLTVVNGEFVIENNPLLSSICSFSNVTTLSGFFSINGTLLTQIIGFESLTTIGGNVLFFGNDNLTVLPDFQSLTNIDGWLKFISNTSLTDLNTFSNLTSIGDDLFFEANSSLSDIEGLNNVVTIGGDLFIENSQISTGFDSLVSIGGYFRFKQNPVTEFSGFDTLQSIGDYFSIFDHGHDFEYFYWPPNLTSIGTFISVVGNNGLVEMPGMNVLTSVGSNVQYYENPDLIKVEMNGLSSVPGFINISSIPSSLKSVSYTSLLSVGEYIDIQFLSETIDFANLETVGDYLRFQDLDSNDGDLDYVGLNINALSSVGTSITIDGHVNSFLGFENLTVINGSLTLDLGTNIPDLHGFDNVTSIGGNCILKGEIASFTGLDNLTTIGGDLEVRTYLDFNNPSDIAADFTGLDQLETISGSMLVRGDFESFNGLSSLNSIGVDLKLQNINNILNLEGLESLLTVDGELLINANPLLESLQGLDNLNYNLIDALYINTNENLTACSILTVCGFLESYTNYSIYNNAEGCDDEIQIQNLCSFNTISGNIKFDFNVNDCDVSDYDAAGILVNTTNGTSNYSTITNSSGDYNIYVGAGTFETSINESSLPQDFAGTPLNFTTNFTNFGNTETIDFCLTASEVINDLNITIIPLTQSRPGFDSTYQLVYQNNGTTVLSGNVTFMFDALKMQFLSANETVTSQTAGNLTFNYSDLNPFETRTIDLEFNIMPPPDVNGDDLLTFVASITPNTADISVSDNTYELDVTVVNSYDPNDKKVLQGEEIDFDETEKYLDYVIRFQNTGSASAINVRLTDQLDNRLDWNTLKPISSSHSYRVQITNGDFIEFIFNDINLADSTNDEPNSHGYIAYKIKPKGDVIVGDIFYNTADIFFDFNTAIVTNTVATEIVESLSVGEFNRNTFSIYPNPTVNQLTINSKTPLNNITVFDINGRKVKAVKLSNNTLQYQLDVVDLANGMYFIELVSGNTEQTQKFIKK